MKQLLLLVGLAVLFSCKEEESVESNERAYFYELDYRVGIWVSPDSRDTLEFVDHSILIRKGDVYGYEEYSYWIDDDTLFVGSLNVPGRHAILSHDENSVTLGNMYITIGFADNSGTFIKNP